MNMILSAWSTVVTGIMLSGGKVYDDCVKRFGRDLGS